MSNFIINKFKKNILKKKYNNFISDVNYSINSKETLFLVNIISQLIVGHFNNKHPKRQLKIVILLPRDIRYLLSIFSIWNLNNIVVNLNIEHSIDFNRKIIRDLKPDLIISEKIFFREHTNKTLILGKIEELLKLKITIQGCYKPNFEIAYIIFTSGSTGQPKGVVITASSYYSYNRWLANYFKNHLKNKRLIITSQLTFDITFGDIAFSLQSSSPICLCNNTRNIFQIFYLIQKYKINVIYSVPTILNKLYFLEKTRKTKLLSNIKLIKSGGESFNVATFNLMRKISKNAAIYNVYGPTEVTINCSAIHLNLYQNIIDKYNQIPIGKIFSHLSYKLLKNNNNSFTLYVSGKQVMKGYIKSKSISHFKIINKKKYYNTGDIVEKKNGQLFLLGRTNNLIKFKGIRFNPIIIDNIMLDLEFIDEVKSLIVKKFDVEKILIFYKSNNFNKREVLKKIYSHISDSIKPLMFIKMKIMPLNNAGKYDIDKMLKLYDQNK